MAAYGIGACCERSDWLPVPVLYTAQTIDMADLLSPHGGTYCPFTRNGTVTLHVSGEPIDSTFNGGHKMVAWRCSPVCFQHIGWGFYRIDFCNVQYLLNLFLLLRYKLCTEDVHFFYVSYVTYDALSLVMAQ